MEEAAGQERHTFSTEVERTGKLAGTGDAGPPTMRAVVLSAPGGVDKLVVKDVPLHPGQRVATMMGGMGRSIDGGYAQYTLVPVSQVIPFDSKLPWEILGALPEMFQTAYGSLSIGLDLRAGQCRLIRGGTSTVGLAAAVMAKDLGATVLSTTRRPERAQMLRALGVDHPIVDDGDIAGTVRKSARTASMRHWNSSAPGICRTHCSGCASTAPSASPAHCQRRGPSKTSAPSGTSRTGSG